MNDELYAWTLLGGLAVLIAPWAVQVAFLGIIGLVWGLRQLTHNAE